MVSFFPGVRLFLAATCLTASLVGVACPKDQQEAYPDLRPAAHLRTASAPGPTSARPGIPEAVQRTEREVSVQDHARALEHWLYAAQNTLVTGSKPVPSVVQDTLAGLIDSTVLADARFRIGSNRLFDEAQAAEHLGETSDVDTVTLINVIVFRGPAAASDLCLWAHALTHAKQFRYRGTRRFSRAYAENPASQEDEANRVQHRCEAMVAKGRLPARIDSAPIAAMARRTRII